MSGSELTALLVLDAAYELVAGMAQAGDDEKARGRAADAFGYAVHAALRPTAPSDAVLDRMVDKSWDRFEKKIAELALEDCRLFAARHRKEEWAATILRFCKTGGATGSPLRSPSPTSSAPAEPSETGWLIERKAHQFGMKSFPARWWNGGGSPMTGEDCWTADANASIRFCRAEDASAALIALMTRDGARTAAQRAKFIERVTITEHMWSALAASPSPTSLERTL